MHLLRCPWTRPPGKPASALKVPRSPISGSVHRHARPHRRADLRQPPQGSKPGRSHQLEAQLRQHRQGLTKAENAKERLLDAYLSGDLVKDQFIDRQDKLTRQIASAQRAIATCDIRWHDIERHVGQILDLAQNAGRAYGLAPHEVRRRLNRAFFTKLHVDVDHVVGAELTDTFAAIVTDDVVHKARVASDKSDGTDNA